MHNQESILENEMHKILWDFEVKTNHPISARRPHLIIINKKDNLPSCGLYFPVDHRVKLKESEKKDKYFDLGRELRKLWKMKVTIIPIVIGTHSTVTKGLVNVVEDLEIKSQWRQFKL